jgi:thymidylate kinase
MTDRSVSADEPAGAFFRALFSRLESDAVTYCVLGAHERAVEWTDGDVDVWVAADDGQTAADAVYEVATELDWAVLESNTSPRLNAGAGKYVVVSRATPDTVVHVDLWTFVYWRSIPVLDNEVVERTRIEDGRGFYVAAPGVEAADSLVGDVLHDRPLSDARRDRIAECLDRDDEGTFERVLDEPFGTDLANALGTAAREERWDRVTSMRPTLRARLRRRSATRHPVRTVRRALRYGLTGLRYRLLSEHGAFVAVVGPDGAGKTTTAEAILDSRFARRAFDRQTYWYRDIPVLPTMGELAARLGLESLSTAATPDGPTDERDLEPLPVSRALIYPVYYALNDALGRVRLARGKTDGGSVMVCDRYFYEFELQPQYDNCPDWLVSACESIVPDPDVLVFATADAETIRSRRAELPLAEIERQQDVCRALVDDHDAGVTIETVGGTDAVVETIQRAVLNDVEEDDP